MTGIPPNASWNTLGSAINTSDGPASGFNPATLKTAGKITIPAITATIVSMTLTVSAVFVIFVSFEKYEA